MNFSISEWTRFEEDGTPVWIRSTSPSWIVPNSEGDAILQALSQGSPMTPDFARFCDRLPQAASPAYSGRAVHLVQDRLSELWFHITDRCNMACTHCLFASGPGDRTTLPASRIRKLATEAYGLGTRIFALTGGEPFMHPEIHAILDDLFALGEDVHVVILTNGLLAKTHLVPHVGQRWPKGRIHLQVSVDGTEALHDAIRGKGAFRRLEDALSGLADARIPVTLSMCVDRTNADAMDEVVRFAAKAGAANIHFMWYFIRGRGDDSRYVDPLSLYPRFVAAAGVAEEEGVTIDNLAAIDTQIFAPSGTRHDGSTACWESLAVGPDGKLYPSAALVGIEALGVPLDSGLEAAWRSEGAFLRVRNRTIAEDPSPFRYFTGGGDFDHVFMHGGMEGRDPYLPLLEKMMVRQIVGEAKSLLPGQDGEAGLLFKMGDRLESCGAHGSVALVHPNCLLSVSGEDAVTAVKNFYSEAATTEKIDILNPVCYPDEMMAHLPEPARFRGYGCGSPVLESGLGAGDRLLDLGSGRGTECFIAAKIVGETGSAAGVDMLDPMLKIARALKGEVEANLGYANLDFHKGFLEELPVASGSKDVVISNCVMNLSVNKRRAFAEIYRVLDGGGRLVISDVVCVTEPDPAIRNDDVLKGECIAGALTLADLIGMLMETGFGDIRIHKWFPYREVAGHWFYSMTYEAKKPAKDQKTVSGIYRGPFPGIRLSGGREMLPGRVVTLFEEEARSLGDAFFELDGAGMVTNLDIGDSCCCAVPPEKRDAAPQPETGRMDAGCMVCGKPLVYGHLPQAVTCVYCGIQKEATAVCEDGHYVCDACHAEDALSLMRRVLMDTREPDMIKLFAEVRNHPAIPVHGPEHHSLIPAVVVAAYGNTTGTGVNPLLLDAAISRGQDVPGGACGFWGVCGAASGVGIGFSVILEATPITPKRRQAVQAAVGNVISRIAEFEAGRCCQRDGWVALKAASELSKEVLGVHLQAEEILSCTQKSKNPECIGRACPLC